MEVKIKGLEELFSFISKQHWINKGQSWYKNSGVPTSNTLAIDAMGRVCTRGEHFSRAEDENTYPITVYKLNETP